MSRENFGPFATTPDARRGNNSPPPRVCKRVKLKIYLPRPWDRLIHAVITIALCFMTDFNNPLGIAAATLITLSLTPGIYQEKLNLAALDQLPRLITTCLVSSLVIPPLFHQHLSTSQAIFFSTALTLSLAGATILASLIQRRGRLHNPHKGSRTLIIGEQADAEKIYGELEQSPEFGLTPVAIVTPSSDLSPDRFRNDIFMERFSNNFPRLIKSYQATTLLIMLSDAYDDQLIKVLRSLTGMHVEIYQVPRLPQFFGDNTSTEPLGSIRVRRVPQTVHRSLTWFWKRPFDAVISGLALLLLSPLLLVLALLVKFDNPRSDILFRQERIGMGGKSFTMLKFRSMTPTNSTDSQFTWSIAGDSKITPLGRFMRRFSLDELPQIYNVFRGDMSLVGPRPERPHFVAEFGREIQEYSDRHRVPVGLTGWAAVSGFRGDTSIESRAAYDNYYIDNWSLWFDLKIIILTFRAVFTGSGQ